LILGNGGAAAHAAIGVREAGFSGEVIMVSDLAAPAFNPMLAPYYLKGSLSWKHCFPFGPDLYPKYDLTCHFGAAVVQLDPLQKTVLLAGGKTIHYDKCLLATGAEAVMPPIPGLRDCPRALPLRTPNSTLKMHEAMQSARKAVVLGASLVGMKVAEILTKMGKKVTLLDVATQVMPRGASPITAKILQKYVERQGIEVRLNCGLKSLERHKERVRCFLADGTVEEADFVAVSTGISPNLKFLEPGLVKTDQAVVVDDHLQTSVVDLFAAGDVCQGMNRQTGLSQWLGTWGNACWQGRIAGYNMAGKAAALPGFVPQHVSPIFGWVYAQIGDVNREDKNIRTVVSGDPEGPDGWQLLTYDKEVLIGANVINTRQRICTLKRAITNSENWQPEYPVLKVS